MKAKFVNESIFQPKSPEEINKQLLKIDKFSDLRGVENIGVPITLEQYEIIYKKCFKNCNLKQLSFADPDLIKQFFHLLEIKEKIYEAINFEELNPIEKMNLIPKEHLEALYRHLFRTTIHLYQLNYASQDLLTAVANSQEIKQKIFSLAKEEHSDPIRSAVKRGLYRYLTDEEAQELYVLADFKSTKENNREYFEKNNPSIPKTKSEYNKLLKNIRYSYQKEIFSFYLTVLKGDLPFNSINQIVLERIKLNQFRFFYRLLSLLFQHIRTIHAVPFTNRFIEVVNGKTLQKSLFRRPSVGRQWAYDEIRDLEKLGIFKVIQKGRSEYVSWDNSNLKEENDFVNKHYKEFINTLNKNISIFKINGFTE